MQHTQGAEAASFCPSVPWEKNICQIERLWLFIHSGLGPPLQHCLRMQLCRIGTSSTSFYPLLLRIAAISFKKTCCNLVGERGGVLCVFAPTQCKLIVCEIPPQWLAATKDKLSAASGHLTQHIVFDTLTDGRRTLTSIYSDTVFIFWYCRFYIPNCNASFICSYWSTWLCQLSKRNWVKLRLVFGQQPYPIPPTSHHTGSSGQTTVRCFCLHLFISFHLCLVQNTTCLQVWNDLPY